MHPLPHSYRAAAAASVDGLVTLSSPSLADLESAPPIEFDGPGGHWSPETLLLAALADCLILTFRAVAKASRLEWKSIRCEVEGTLDRVERAMQFTGFHTRATIAVPSGVAEATVRRAMEKSERNCIISQSLKAKSVVDVVVEIG